MLVDATTVRTVEVGIHTKQDTAAHDDRAPGVESRSFARSSELAARLNLLVPGGAHTYAKGDDQFPEGMAPIIEQGSGCRVWDVDGNEYIEYGMGLRAVTLGHAYPAVTSAVAAQLEHGTNFVRPSRLELEAAETFLGLVTRAEMARPRTREP
jgi:glutamate-1-semialdehyde 2,1-aminomutase